MADKKTLHAIFRQWKTPSALATIKAMQDKDAERAAQNKRPLLELPHIRSLFSGARPDTEAFAADPDNPVLFDACVVNMLRIYSALRAEGVDVPDPGPPPEAQ